MGACQQMLMGYKAASGGFPLTLPNLLAWYDASDTSSLTLSGSNVTAWTDKSGNGYNLTTNGTGNLVSGSTVNGLNAVTGAAVSMSFVSSLPVLPTGSFYAFVVGGQTAACIWIDGNGAGANPYIINPRSGGVMYASLPDGDILGFTGLGAATSNGSINLMSHNAGTDSVLSFNSSTYTATGVNDGFTVRLMFGRGGFNLQGTACEVFFGGSALNSTQISDAKNYLKTKWATP